MKITNTIENNPDKNLLSWNIPIEVTASGKTYFDSAKKTISFFFFIIERCISLDKGAIIAKLALDGKEIPPNIHSSDFIGKNPGPSTKYLRKNSQLFLEIFITRLMDNFTTYLSDIVREAFKAKPQILNYKETVRLDQIMKFNSLENFYEDLIDQEVMRLSYLGFLELEEWLQKKMGVNLSPSTKERESIIEFIETRNIIVHNRGLISQKYLNSVKNTNYLLGKQRELDVDYLFTAIDILNKVVSWIDDLFCTKFDLIKVSLQIVNRETLKK